MRRIWRNCRCLNVQVFKRYYTVEDNRKLVDYLKERGVVKTRRIENVMKAVDRGLFIEGSHTREDLFYKDHAQFIGYNATISAPHMHAMCLELLEDHVNDGDTVLDVGCGSGYMLACLSQLVGKNGKVVGIDCIPELVDFSKQNISKLDTISTRNIIVEHGTGWKGHEALAPYDCIHVGAAAKRVPEALVDQLKPGGRMVIPVGEESQDLLQIDKRNDGSGECIIKSICSVIFVPLLPV
eukprot:TRINITY_DN10997_c0_g1_i1.p1 TRINITY_DN10997_c0_g1~~TRINITY_DN10997_c0_g1_i1.p1  ORF type:complete len:239 (+),score=29.36 TRINITY_DN10997_c0_g1_i1:127-843(+)